ncbi:RNA polymerase sigma factor [Phenylobacterium aquaticum]|uniref:RNA polymerase sigma factor n=1 Tax=Phenylobacterium aquaticum TaxID=1763816 RepID=UPI001F5CCCF3|nr:sigma-70 family RNA polymerase sigma factor [Phenylobacterium aquaticum]MCI3130834.1 sigma-70 family RNA polymerase sigma factor [Phenylobacterium aquaticum]
MEPSAARGFTDPAAERLGRRLAAERAGQVRFLRGRLPSHEDAEDAWQDASIKFLQHAGTLQAAERPEAWMAVSLRRIVVDRYRRAAVRRRLAETLAAQPAPDGPGEEEDLAAATECLKGLLATLKPDYAQMLQQTYLAERPLKQVAGGLGLTTNNAGVRLHRARAALRQALSEKCHTCALADCWAKARLHQLAGDGAEG